MHYCLTKFNYETVLSNMSLLIFIYNGSFCCTRWHKGRYKPNDETRQNRIFGFTESVALTLSISVFSSKPLFTFQMPSNNSSHREPQLIKKIFIFSNLKIYWMPLALSVQMCIIESRRVWHERRQISPTTTTTPPTTTTTPTLQPSIFFYVKKSPRIELPNTWVILIVVVVVAVVVRATTKGQKIIWILLKRMNSHCVRV